MSIKPNGLQLAVSAESLPFPTRKCLNSKMTFTQNLQQRRIELNPWRPFIHFGCSAEFSSKVFVAETWAFHKHPHASQISLLKLITDFSCYHCIVLSRVSKNCSCWNTMQTWILAQQKFRNMNPPLLGFNECCSVHFWERFIHFSSHFHTMCFCQKLIFIRNNFIKKIFAASTKTRL